MEKIILVKPNLSYADEIIKYKEESLKESPLINGSAGLDSFSSIKDWLEELKRRSSEDTVPEGLVPSSTYLGIRERDNYIVGMIDIRHYLNEYLTQVGGNIGYSVRKTERNKGYAKQMLKLALEKCKDLKIKKVLITCDEDNIASEKVILSAGAKLEDIRFFEGKNRKRFWIDTITPKLILILFYSISNSFFIASCNKLEKLRLWLLPISFNQLGIVTFFLTVALLHSLTYFIISKLTNVLKLSPSI